MADIKGTNVAAPIVPYTSDDIYATHEAKYGKGGYRTVQNIEERDSIPGARLEEGMLVYVIDDPDSVHTYQYLNGAWVRNRLGLGIPILNQELIDQYALNWNKDSYISIGNKNTDPNGNVTQNTYTTSVNGNYIDILFQAIRALQSEVAKLKNSFNYGIESYTGTQTAMSRAQADLNGEQPDFPDEEPLWAVEEDGLSQLGNDIVLGSGHEFKSPDEAEGDISIITDEDNNYTSYVKFNVPNCYLDFNDENEYFKDIVDCKDSKIYFFITSSSTNITLDLDSFGSEVNDDGPTELPPLELNLENIDLGNRVSEKGVYNILVIISRKQKLKGNIIVEDDGETTEEETGDYYGKNFIWISISDPGADYNIVDGYYNESNPGSLSKSLLELDYRYVPDKIIFNKKDTIISKLKVYSKYQDFSENIIANKPSDEDYKFKAAHITIRSVENAEVLDSVKKQILNNELIYEEASGKLWIKTNGTLRPISGSGSSDNTDEDTMTDEELREKLGELGIIVEETADKVSLSSNGNRSLSLNSIGDITFIHQSTGKKFKFTVNERGELESQMVPNTNDTFPGIINKSNSLSDDLLDNNSKTVRGFISIINNSNKTDVIGSVNADSDLKLNTDRVRIGAFYAPLENDIVHGCSHSYVELENTSDKDYPLIGCYLHWTGVIDNDRVTYHLPLTGTIKAGSTYLIRGKQHAEFEDSNVFIKVKTYDQEWYLSNGELISFEISNNNSCGFALTYGLKDLTPTYSLWGNQEGNNKVGELKKDTYPYVIDKRLLDSIYYPSILGTTGTNSTGYWAKTAVNIKSNTLYRNTFELDPAKQAFQAFNTKDSSRARWANASNDYQVVDLSREYISFPHSEDRYAIANYTPKASWEDRNVCTDKTKLDKNKPNMVTTSFGIDIYKTRCFNWISVGYYDEYVWLRKQGSNNWTNKFNSYLPIIEIKSDGENNLTIVNKESIPKDLGNYTKLLNNIGDLIRSISITAINNNNITLNNTENIQPNSTYFIISKNDNYYSSEFPKKRFFSDGDITNNIYARITGRFPADNSFYTSHKVIVDIIESSVDNDPEIWEYIVGRADINGDPDPEHCSNIMRFTLYPKSYTPRIYQTTDQQGFHWIEYQVWAAAANEINKRIESDQRYEQIIPILVNTGDMTQNGTRINEWYDYYQAGRHLFDHLEQMNVVGNNDLCGTNVNELGTGDDNGKSNSFFFHLFYCYEINSGIFTPLLPNLVNLSASRKYVPSLYYIDTTNYRFLFVNSEITETNCRDWYGLVDGSSTVNAYTGYKIKSNVSAEDYVGRTDNNNNGFTTIYTMIFNILSDASDNEKKVVILCHEMPFTVITKNSILRATQMNVPRSFSNTGALIGSHLNQISNKEKIEGEDNTKSRGLYWFSRLLEHFKVRLVLGGHKHTYACTYPIREYYYYGEDQNSMTNGPMNMEETLENDEVIWLKSGKNLTKFPLTRRGDVGDGDGTYFFPYTPVPDLQNGIIYFMCQASGYKLTSNKELPTSDQKFSQIIPQTDHEIDETTNLPKKDTPNTNQKYPMFCIISFNNNDTANLKLIRIKDIMVNGTFNQTTYSTSTPSFEYMKKSDSNDYGIWELSEGNMISSISLVADTNN